MLKRLMTFLCVGGIVISLINCGDDDATPCAAAPQAEAGADQIVEGTTVVLGANDPEGSSGTWSIITGTGGTFDDATDPGATFTGTVDETYTLAWTLAGCPESVDEVIVQFVAECMAVVIPEANAGPDQATGETQVTLAANNPTPGIGTWSVVSGEGGAFEDANDPETEFTGVLGETYELKWTITGCDGSTEDVVVINMLTACQGTVPNANAGEDKLVMHATSVTLEANAADNVVGTWTIVSGEGGSFSDPLDPEAMFIGEIGETYVLQWTLCPNNEDYITVSFRGLSKKQGIVRGEIIDLSIVEYNLDPSKVTYLRVNSASGFRNLYPINYNNKRLRVVMNAPVQPIYEELTIVQADNFGAPNPTLINTNLSFEMATQLPDYRFSANTPNGAAKGSQITLRMIAPLNTFDVRIVSVKFLPNSLEENIICPIVSVVEDGEEKIVTCTIPADLSFNGYSMLKVIQGDSFTYSTILNITN